MTNSYPAKIGTKLGDCAGPNYRPDGRVHPGHLTGLQNPMWRPIPLDRQPTRCRGPELGRKAMVNPIERLSAEWQFTPAAALSDLPYTGMAVMRWTCRTALKREFVSRVGDDVDVFSYVLRNS